LNVQLDNKGGTAQSPTTYNASNGVYVFNDDASVASYAIINGFGADDTIAFTENAQGLVAVSSQGSNVRITVNNDGIVSSILLWDVISPGQIVYDVTSFNQLPIGNITFSGKYQLQNYSLDNFGGTLTQPASFDAGKGSFNFVDDANTASAVRIDRFGNDDTIQLLNASPSDVAVSSKGSDVSFIVNHGGTVSSITLGNVIPAGKIVYDIKGFNALGTGKVLLP